MVENKKVSGLKNGLMDMFGKSQKANGQLITFLHLFWFFSTSFLTFLSAYFTSRKMDVLQFFLFNSFVKQFT